jgi:hypothetical protein
MPNLNYSQLQKKLSPLAYKLEFESQRKKAPDDFKEEIFSKY